MAPARLKDGLSGTDPPLPLQALRCWGCPALIPAIPIRLQMPCMLLSHYLVQRPSLRSKGFGGQGGPQGKVRSEGVATFWACHSLVCRRCLGL